MTKNPMTLLVLTLLHFSLSQLLVAQELEIASPGSVGFSDGGLERATAALQQHIDNGDIAGVVAAVARDGKLIHGVCSHCCACGLPRAIWAGFIHGRTAYQRD